MKLKQEALKTIVPLGIEYCEEILNKIQALQIKLINLGDSPIDSDTTADFGETVQIVEVVNNKIKECVLMLTIHFLLSSKGPDDSNI